MCVVSYVGDFYGRTIPRDYPWVIPPNVTEPARPGPSQEEFDRLKREVEEMRELLKKAAEIDRKTGQPDCQMDEKLALLRRIAAAVGVDLEEALQGPAAG